MKTSALIVLVLALCSVLAVSCASQIEQKSKISVSKSAEELLAVGIGYAEKGYAYAEAGTADEAREMLDKAIPKFEEAIKIKPDYAEAHYNLAKAHSIKGASAQDIELRNGLFDQAIREHKEAIRLKPDYAEAYVCLGDTYRERGLMAFFGEDKGFLDQAIEAYKEAIRLKPDLADAHLGLAGIYDQKASFDFGLEESARKTLVDQAAAEYKEAISLSPDCAIAHFNLGTIYLQAASRAHGPRDTEDVGMLDQAIREFQEAIQLSPDLAEAHNNLAVAYEKKGLVDEAITELQEAIRLKPDATERYSQLAELHSKKGDYDQAIAVIKKAIVLKTTDKPFPSRLYRDLAETYVQAGREEEVAQLVEELREQSRDDARFYATLGDIYAAAHWVEQAIESYQKAIELEPDSRYFYQLAEAYEQAGQLEKAAEIRTKVRRGILVSEAAPAFTLQDLSGGSVNLSDFKGKVVVLSFWGTWCGASTKEMPHLQRLHEQYADKDAVVLGINTMEREKGTVKPFAEEHHLTFTILLDQAEVVRKAYGVGGIPSVFVIDGEGIIQFERLGSMSDIFDVLSREIEELTGR